MITSMSLANFKCFRSLTLDLGTLNVLAGMNGAGKSTVIQSILAVRQSWTSGSLAEGHIQLSGALADLGTAGGVYCADPSSDTIEIIIEPSEEGPPIELRCYQSEEHSKEYFLRLDTGTRSNIRNTTFGLFTEPFNYLNAERVGPRKVFQIPLDEGHPLWVGKYGENASYIVASERRETPVINEFLILESSDEKEYKSIQYQWALWMARLFPGFDGESEIYNDADQVRLGLALQRRETGQSLFVRPTNTGFGLSYVLGIIVAGLAAKPGTILIVENPEAHLHPKAQSMVGEFLARVAAGGAQVFVETHSEHVLNGVRRMVKQTILTPDTVCLFYFAKPSNDLEPSVTQIPISASGDISTWPEGFFDQLDKDLSVILG
jgi:predicted ATPase